MSFMQFKLERVPNEPLRKDDGIAIGLRLGEIEWTHELKRKKHGRLQCNLQELEILRQLADVEAIEIAVRLKSCDIEYLPQRRYPYLFPHQTVAAHDIFEIVPGMTEKELQDTGNEAIRDSNVLLCPVSASTCEHPSHIGVSEEVYKLAAHLPVRQIMYATAVNGMIDIAPVAICRNDLLHSRCTVFETGKASVTGLPIEIRTNMLLATMDSGVGCKARMGRNNPDIAIHDSWHGEISDITQSAVLQCRYRQATTQPTRLYDSHERITKSGDWPEYYLALSYRWEEWPENNHSMLMDKLDKLSKRLRIRYLWVDRWCIDQQDSDDKAREIARMRDYYVGASACVVMTGPDTKPFHCVPQHDGAILSAFQQVLRNSVGLRSLLRCKWATRVWTLQEALMSRQVIYAVQDQLIDGDYISELVAHVETGGEIYTDDDPERNEWIGGYGCYGWNAKAVSVVPPRQFRIKKGKKQLIIIRSVFGGEQQYHALESMACGILMPFEEALTMIQGRYATKVEDYIYGILGISEGREKISVEYNIGWRFMLGKLQETGMINERQLASPTVNRLPGMSWLPECGSGYVIFQNMERLAAFVRRPKLSWSEQGATVLGVVFEWAEAKYEKVDVINIHGLGCMLVRGTIRFPEVLGLVARVGGTSGSSFTEERLSGTHVMLCGEVDNNTPDAVAIKISGNIEGGHVYREDGYVLELHRWLEGDPKLLKGRQWLIGSAPSN